MQADASHPPARVSWSHRPRAVDSIFLRLPRSGTSQILGPAVSLETTGTHPRALLLGRAFRRFASRNDTRDLCPGLVEQPCELARRRLQQAHDLPSKLVEGRQRRESRDASLIQHFSFEQAASGEVLDAHPAMA